MTNPALEKAQMKLMVHHAAKDKVEQEKEQAVGRIVDQVVGKKERHLTVLEAIEALDDKGEGHVAQKEESDQPKRACAIRRGNGQIKSGQPDKGQGGKIDPVRCSHIIGPVKQGPSAGVEGKAEKARDDGQRGELLATDKRERVVTR